jgi:2-polyprenyl-3-methyl-5-hydroxy-6-metoxy-1,4-benzoquinol methylase
MTNKERVRDINSFSVKDYFLTQEEFDLIENKEFGFLETHPKPINNLASYYLSEDYISHNDGNKSFFEKLYQFTKKYNLRYKFSLIKNKKVGFSLLDYGCGTGDFLAYAKKKNTKVFGIEPNEKALKIAQEKAGKDTISNHTIFELEEKFDVITLWHVLEHIPDLYAFLDEVGDKLNSKGELLIAVPNYKSFDANFYKNYWAAYDVPRHLWHFSPESLEKLFLNFGMKLVKRYPLWFDSYYVSLLSEKYKKSKVGFIRAIAIASFSNFLAIFTGNYSSVVFQFKKVENKSK